MAELRPFVSKLDTKITLYRLTAARNAVGEPKLAKETVCVTKAAVRDVSGAREAEESLRLVTDRSYVIRKRAGVESGKELRLQDGDAVYLVEAVRKINRSHLELICTSFGDDVLPE